jgi:hypothetical protein
VRLLSACRIACFTAPTVEWMYMNRSCFMRCFQHRTTCDHRAELLTISLPVQRTSTFFRLQRCYTATMVLRTPYAAEWYRTRTPVAMVCLALRVPHRLHTHVAPVLLPQHAPYCSQPQDCSEVLQCNSGFVLLRMGLNAHSQVPSSPYSGSLQQLLCGGEPRRSVRSYARPYRKPGKHRTPSARRRSSAEPLRALLR